MKKKLRLAPSPGELKNTTNALAYYDTELITTVKKVFLGAGLGRFKAIC
jgi:hypothetical protein